MSLQFSIICIMSDPQKKSLGSIYTLSDNLKNCKLLQNQS